MNLSTIKHTTLELANNDKVQALVIGNSQWLLFKSYWPTINLALASLGSITSFCYVVWKWRKESKKSG